MFNTSTGHFLMLRNSPVDLHPENTISCFPSSSDFNLEAALKCEGKTVQFTK